MLRGQWVKAAAAAAFVTALGLGSAVAAGPGSVKQTPTVRMKLPIKVEAELSPAGSLKQAPLWKELYQLLIHPYGPDEVPGTADDGTVVRRPGFGVAMPPLEVYPLGYNFLTGQPMRLRTSTGEVSWDQPGPLFDPDEAVAVDAFNTPTGPRTVVGHLVACPDTPAYQAATVPAAFCDGKPDGSLVVFNDSGSTRIPPNGTVVAVAAVKAGALQKLDGRSTTQTVPVTQLQVPVNEEDFFRRTNDTTGVPSTLRPYLGRLSAEVLGKALFWDMQVGSDGVQSCASCHFHAGADARSRNGVNPGIVAGDTTINVNSAAGSPTTNVEIQPADFPFHKGGANSLLNDSNDVFSSMGVSRYKKFVDIPVIGASSYLPAKNGIRALAPDIGLLQPDPVPVMQGVRRVEPRNTPTIHGAAFNLDNFWDGRARFAFNGGSVWGPADPTFHVFINPGLSTTGPGEFAGATMGHLRPALLDRSSAEFNPALASQPVRINFSSLGSQAIGPPLSSFEMSYDGRNFPKIGKKLLQGDTGSIETQGNGAPQQPGTNRVNAVVPLANQLVAADDSRLGPFSNQGGSVCAALGRPTAVGKPGLCISYSDLIRLAFNREYWNRTNRKLIGAAAPCDPLSPALNGVLSPAGCDPFDGYTLTVSTGSATPTDRNQFTQMEANFSLFFGLAVQAYESLTIPDNTPADRFFELNPNAHRAIGQPRDEATLFATLIPDLLDDGLLNGTGEGKVRLLPDDPSTPFYDGFGPDEVYGFDIFAGANLTAGLVPGESVDARSGIDRNPLVTNTLGQSIRVGSNPLTRSVRCAQCHMGPEQTSHSINITHGLLEKDIERRYPLTATTRDPTTPATFADGQLASPRQTATYKTVSGLLLALEVGQGGAREAVKVEPRDFAITNDPETPWDDRAAGQPSNASFGDLGIYNIGVRPSSEDHGRGGTDGYGWPLSLAALTLKNIGGPAFQPCDTAIESCVMQQFDPVDPGATFAATGGGVPFPGSTLDLQSINPGLERGPKTPKLPQYLAFWTHALPAGEHYPAIGELAGMVPNTLTAPNGERGIDFAASLFGADLHCARFDPALFGDGPPNFGWGPATSDERLCPQTQSGVAGNFAVPGQGTWPVPNRVSRDGAFKAPSLRNVELTGPYFHTGSYLTLRQVVDFYSRGGDFPATNRESRAGNVVSLRFQASATGASRALNLLAAFDCSADAPNDPLLPLVPGTATDRCGIFSFLAGRFSDGLPDVYDTMPDTDHPITPEYPTFGDAKNALVKFLIAMTDPRVKLEQAPFDHPQLFLPVDGAAPDNTGGPAQLLSQSGVACPVPGPNSGGICFRNIPAVGSNGRPACGGAVPAPDCGPLSNFLGISSDVVPGPSNDQFDPNP